MLTPGHSIKGWRCSPRGSQAPSPNPRGTPRSVSPGSITTRSIPPSPEAFTPNYGSPGGSPREGSPAGATGSSHGIAHTMPKIREPENFGKSLTEALDTSAERRAARGVAG